MAFSSGVMGSHLQPKGRKQKGEGGGEGGAREHWTNGTFVR